MRCSNIFKYAQLFAQLRDLATCPEQRHLEPEPSGKLVAAAEDSGHGEVKLRADESTARCGGRELDLL